MRNKIQLSLSFKTALSSVAACIIAGIVSLVIALSLHADAMSKQYVRQANSLAKQAMTNSLHVADAAGLTRQTMDVYRSLTDEQRAQVGTEQYRSYFESVDTQEKGGSYDVLFHMLRVALDNHEEIFDIYLGMYDRDTCALVYVVDPDPVEALMPGDWERVEEEEVRSFLDGTDDTILYNISRTEKYGLICTVAVPLRGESGEPQTFFLADISMQEIINGTRDFALRCVIGILLLTLIVATWRTWRMKVGLVRPIHQIAVAAKQLATDDERDSKVFFDDLDIHTGDELEDLADTMAEMERSLKAYSADLLRITAEKERISTELSLAKTIQASMLPHTFPPYPDREEFDIYASMEPARDVGGDFYDFFLIDRDHLCLVMADVSGKGIPAALFMMTSKTILQSWAMREMSPARILTRMNDEISANNQAEMFVTIWVGILEISTGKMTCANAGHEYPAIKRAGGKFELFKDKHDIVIGWMEGLEYEEYSLQLHAGDCLFLYTDGVPEATDAEKQMFGLERMIDALNATPDAAPRQLLSNVRESVRGFVKDAEQFDDLTMLCLAYEGPAAMLDVPDQT